MRHHSDEGDGIDNYDSLQLSWTNIIQNLRQKRRTA
jgi:hypothetical protein